MSMFDLQIINTFLSGIVTLGYWVGGLFFFHYWRQTGDRLFQKFGFALWMLMAERFLFLLIEMGSEYRPYVYLVRLAAFVLIGIAVIDKNRRENTPRPESRG